jgi:hypothetical protein
MCGRRRTTAMQDTLMTADEVASLMHVMPVWV